MDRSRAVILIPTILHKNICDENWTTKTGKCWDVAEMKCEIYLFVDFVKVVCWTGASAHAAARSVISTLW